MQLRVFGRVLRVRPVQPRIVDGVAMEGLGSILIDSAIGQNGGYSPQFSIAFGGKHSAAVDKLLKPGSVADLLIAVNLKKDKSGPWFLLDMIVDESVSGQATA